MNDIIELKRLPFPRAGAVYLLGAALGTLLVAGSTCIDRNLGTGELVTTVAKLLMTAALILTARVFGGLGRLTEGGYFSRYLPLVLLFPACSLVMNAGPLTGTLPFGAAVMWLLGLVAGVLWEELFFRHTALLLFGRAGLFRPRAVILTCLIFGACRMGNALFLPLGDAALDAALSVCTGVFLTALYLRTKNLLVPLTAHFLMRFTTELFSRLSDAPGSLDTGFLFPVFYGLVLLVIGGILLVRGRRAEP